MGKALPALLLSCLPLLFMPIAQAARDSGPVQPPAVVVQDAEDGSISGIVKDPANAFVHNAKIILQSLRTGLSYRAESDVKGQFAIAHLASGHYRLSVTAEGFDTATEGDLEVRHGSETTVSFSLTLPRVKTEVEVRAEGEETSTAIRAAVNADDQARSRNTAEILLAAPGVSLRDNGQLAAVPLLHGLGDERAKILVDGVTVSSSCPNHMNTPLSYSPPSRVAQVMVVAGITPVSLGGDSVGGTISIESLPPVFADGLRSLREEGYLSGFYRSNGNNRGGNVFESISVRNASLIYNGSWASSDDYTDGSGHKVTSTYSQTTDHVVNVALQGRRNLIVAEGGLHHTPYEGFPGAQMDQTRNVAESANVRFQHEIGEGGALNARLFWQHAWHSMNIGHDKSAFPMPMDMPMNTRGRDLGYAFHLELPVNARHTLRAGNELHRFMLDDAWPPVAGAAPYMGPDTFVNIHDGMRRHMGTFVEASSHWNLKWMTLLGIRGDTVWMNAGAVHGYSAMYAADASAFNAANRARTDSSVDVTAATSYAITRAASVEIGYARKTRAPNLYERYAWSTDWMTSGMIGWFNDGNYYVGAIRLSPETADTVSATASARGGASSWEFKVTPYWTRIYNFIDVDTLATTTYGMSTFAKLHFANHDARTYGADFSARSTLWDSHVFGQATVSAIAGWLRGERPDTHTGLYQMMPLHGRFAFEEGVKGLSAGAGLELVDRKSRVDPSRMEQMTPGYGLLSVHGGWKSKHFEASGSVENLANRAYELPLGGVNFDDFMAGMWMGSIHPLTGRGRSGSFSMTARF